MFPLILLQRIAFRIQLSFSADVGPQHKKRPDLALTEHKRRGHLTPAELAECAAREPSAAIESIGKDLPADILAECAAREPSAAIRCIGKDLPADILAECAAREPYAAIESIGKDLPADILKYCRDRT